MSRFAQWFARRPTCVYVYGMKEFRIRDPDSNNLDRSGRIRRTVGTLARLVALSAYGRNGGSDLTDDPPSAAQADGLRPDQAAFREIYEELVETNTTLSAGNCTEAAQKMAARLRAAGYPEATCTCSSTPDHPKEGGLVAILPGTDPKARPILLLAHIDVVEARREDWERDPFTLVEEGGYFYARGSLDDKSMAATWVDTLIRLRGERTKPRRTVKMALTCGEETRTARSTAPSIWSRRSATSSTPQFALNEGAWGMLDASGKRVMMGVQAGEKTSQDFRLEVTTPAVTARGR